MPKTALHESADHSALRPMLRFLTCGSVDDGKSTLIGRLLWEQNLIFDDQLASLRRAQKGGQGDAEIDFAMLVDGLEAEWQQGITIDVAYRYFKTQHRSFVVADTPGHAQYTRNMATGASNADLAILLVDARKGLLTQTHRHAAIVSMLGIRHVVLAVNKMDLVDYHQTVFDDIVAAFEQFAVKLDFSEIVAIPLSARIGDNLSTSSARMPWYTGPSLITYLEGVDVVDADPASGFRMPVQWIIRAGSDFRGYAGTIVGGPIGRGDEIVVASSGRSSTITRIMRGDAERSDAEAGDAVTLVLADDIDIARGDVLATPRARPQVEDGFIADLIWMSDRPLDLARSYILKIATRTVLATVKSLSHRIDVDTLAHESAAHLEMNEIGHVTMTMATPVAFDCYLENRAMGAFILIDGESNETVGAGMIRSGLRRATNVFPQNTIVTREDRARLKRQRSGVVWFTGLSGAGKSSIANRVESRLNLAGVHTMIIDGDNVRHGLSKDLGFSQGDRYENIRRVAELARLMADAGLIVLCCFISPFRDERKMARAALPDGEFLEVFVDATIETCMQRDTKGLYRRALAGEIKDFTGVDQPYEPSLDPDVIVGRDGEDIDLATSKVIDALLAKGLIGAFGAQSR